MNNMRDIRLYIPQGITNEVFRVLNFGDRKHPGENWKKQSVITHLWHAIGHIFHYLFIGKKDKETQCSHLAHAVCRLMFAMGVK